MKSLPVTAEMKAQLQPFFVEETRRYDLDAIREWKRENEPPRQMFADIFAGFGDDDQEVEHDLLSAAIALNAEADENDPEVQDVDAFVADTASGKYTDDKKAAWVRINQLTESNRRAAVRRMLHIIDNDAPRNVQWNIIWSLVHQWSIGCYWWEDEAPNLSKAYEFASNAGTETENLPEEYLVSIGL